MTVGQMTFKQGRAAAQLLHELRPDWDMAGIEAELQVARQLAPAFDLAIAAIRAAKDTKNRTPKIIGLAGPHWRGSDVAPQHPQPEPGQRCSICSEEKSACLTKWAHNHQFLSVEQARANAREVAAGRGAVG